MQLFQRFYDRPQQLAARKLLFQIHLWVGIGLGLYLFVIGVSGAAIVFIDEMEAALYSNLFHAADGSGEHAGVGKVMKEVKAAYPSQALVSIYPPSKDRQTFMVYTREGEKYRAVFTHPVTAKVLGEVRPEKSFLRWLQDLHFNLLSGRTGRVVNGVGGMFLLLLCTTGLIIWWPGVKNWKRGLKVAFSKKWKRINWDLHSAAGFWTLILLTMWAITGIYFGFPQQFRKVVSWFSPVTFEKPPVSDPKGKGKQPVIAPETFIAEAGKISLQSKFAGFVIPATDRAPFLVFMAREEVGDFENTDYVYFDQFTGKFLWKWQRGVNHSAGDVVMSWLVPLHFGTFGGVGVKILWVIFGLVPPMLFVTGSLMWWNRVLSKKWAKWKVREPASAMEFSQRT